MDDLEEFPLEPVKRHFLSRAVITDILPNEFGNPLGVLDYYEPDSAGIVSIVEEKREAQAPESNKRREGLDIGDIADVEILRREIDGSYSSVVLADDFPLYAEEAARFFDLNAQVGRGRVFRTAEGGSPIIRVYTGDFSTKSGFLVVNSNTAGFKRAIQEEVVSGALPGRYVIVVKSKEEIKGMGFYYPVTRIQGAFNLSQDGTPVVTWYEKGMIYNMPLLSLSRQSECCKGILHVNEPPYNSKFVPVIVSGTTSGNLGLIINAKIIRWSPTYLTAELVLD